MLIEIAERLRPYSHVPGTYFVLSGSALRLQVFPALIKVDDLSGPAPKPMASIALSIKGPVEDFTVQQDLEKGNIVVWGKSKTGYFRYKVNATESGAGIILKFDKKPAEDIALSSEGEWMVQSIEGQYVIAPSAQVKAWEILSPVERLSLGSNKSQDWTLLRKRGNLEDIFPLWHRLGQLTPKVDSENETGTALLLEKCREAIAGPFPEKILEPFRELFLAGFDFALSPRLYDADHLGIIADTSKLEGSPLQLLTEGARLIHSLFVRCDAEGIHLLPALPPEFHCGRLLSPQLNVEWTKKAIRRFVFTAIESRQAAFIFYQGKTRCRLRTSHKDRGAEYISGAKLDLVAGTSYWFDNFQK